MWRKFYIFGARLRDFWQFGRFFGPFGLILVNIDHFQSNLIIFSQSWTFSVEIGRFLVRIGHFSSELHIFWSNWAIFRRNWTFFGRIEPFFVEIWRIFWSNWAIFCIELINPLGNCGSDVDLGPIAKIGSESVGLGFRGGVPGPTYQGGPLAQSTGVIFGGSFPGINEALFQCSGADFSIFSRKNAIFGRFLTNFVILPWSIDFACHCVSKAILCHFWHFFCFNSSIFWSILTFFDPNFQFLVNFFNSWSKFSIFGQLFQFLIKFYNCWAKFSIREQIFQFLGRLSTFSIIFGRFEAHLTSIQQFFHYFLISKLSIFMFRSNFFSYFM